jgi:hypothetical protein
MLSDAKHLALTLRAGSAKNLFLFLSIKTTFTRVILLPRSRFANVSEDTAR